MATITGYTAQRMKEIEDSTVVGGEVDENTHLILVTRDGTQIDAGSLPPGPEGPAGGIGEAPTDGEYYARKDSNWAPLPNPTSYEDIPWTPTLDPPFAG